MRPKVLAAAEVLRTGSEVIPMGMDDASAFRSSAEVQRAWREVSAGYATIQRAIQLREQMARVGLDDILPGTLEHLLIPTESCGDVEFYSNTRIIDRLLTHARIGTSFVFATTAEIIFARQRATAERKSKEWPGVPRRVVSA